MWRRISIFILSCGVAVAILAYMLFLIWDELMETLASADPRFLVLAVIICITGWWMRGWRYRYILDTLEVKVSLAFSTATIVIPIMLIGIFFLVLVLTGKLTAQNRIFAFLLRMLEGIRRASLSLRSIAVLGVSSLLIWMMDVLACAAVALMFGQEIPFAVIVLAIVVGNLVKAVPVTPGGVGTYEAAV
ncbi:MAG: flippase-like domain-containing protein, partial [Methanomicrobiales archaeon]|nr:flippase-like domain-containing protein [Methanomicrobiales archaeon]